MLPLYCPDTSVMLSGCGRNTHIQVCYDISNHDTKNREEQGLLNTCNEFGLKKGLILILSDEQKYAIDGITIKIIPVYKYFLSDHWEPIRELGSGCRSNTM